MVKVKAIISFNDLEENKHRGIGEEFECSKARCDYLLKHMAIEIVEEIKEEVPVIENVEEKIEEIKESAKEEVELNEFGNPVGTRNIKPKKKKSSKK
jgi:uncharacterized protein YwqG